jgi:hypothetical protein
MGQLRLKVEQSEAAEATVLLPDYWDELDPDEQRDWKNAQLSAFTAAHVKTSMTISE